MTTQTGEQVMKSFNERVEKSFSLMRKPALWPVTTTDQLVDNLVILSFFIGLSTDRGFFEEFRPFYWYVAERTTVERRLEVLTGITEQVERFAAGLGSLLPFLLADEEPVVVSTAALHLSVLIPLRNGDPFTGPKDVLGFLDSAYSDNTRAGILQGVLLLGDRRILPLLDRCWEGLGMEGRWILAHAWSGFVFASTVEFLMGWFERTDDKADHGLIADALAMSVTRQKNAPYVLDEERKFPVNGKQEGPPLRYLHRWTFEEYGKIIAPRLKAIAAAETGEKVMPKVLAAWGIDDAGQPA